MNGKKMKVLLVDDDEAALFGYERSLTKMGYVVSTAPDLQSAKSSVASVDYDALMLDLKLPDGNAIEWIPELKVSLPDLPIIVVTGTNDVPTAVKAMKFGADNFLTKPADIDNLEACLQKAVEVGILRKHDRAFRRITTKNEPYFGNSAAALALKMEIDVAAAGDSVVLILGETGTGKGVLARRIHDFSSRKAGPFVELNCSCLKGDLLRSELFGHAKGSFTTALADREGLVEVADGGTLFLDEIGDMGIDVQTQFLKTIEEKTFRRIGENRLRKSDFRLICATNKDLLQETDKGTFRKDLYYRICVLPITLPPLRKRKEDISGLTDHLLKEFGYSMGPLPTEVLDLLSHHTWPGNIRELRNVLERALLLSRGAPLSAEFFPGLVQEADGVEIPDHLLTLREAEADYLKKVLASCNGDKNKACAFLGISLATLYRKLGPMRPPAAFSA